MKTMTTPKKTKKALAPADVAGITTLRSVRKAREALKERAHEILDKFLQTIDMAASAEEYEAALKSYQWLMEHIPEDEGERVVDISVDKPKQVEKGTNLPTINIGFRLGGIDEDKQLPDGNTIDVTPKR